MLYQKVFLRLKRLEPISVSSSEALHPGFNTPRTQAMKAMKAMKSMKSMKKAALEKMVLSLSVPQK